MKLSRRAFLKGTLITATALPFVTAGYGFMVEPSWIETTLTRIPIPKLKPAFEGFRLVLVSDIHVGTYISQEQLQEVVDLVNQLDADLIIHTGDFVGVQKTSAFYHEWRNARRNGTAIHSPDAERLFNSSIPVISSMKSRFGAVAVLGNHEHWTDADVARRYLKEYGIRLLENTHEVLTIEDASLTFAGVDDLWEGEQDLRKAFVGAPSTSDSPRIVLSHNPDFADSPQVPENKVAFMLSGHTHGGQVTIPGFGPPLLPINNRRYARGLVETDWGLIYITKGVGCTTPPIRLFTRPEIAVLELTAARD